MPDGATSFVHVVPHIGLKEIRLYPPADRVYRFLKKQKETVRLINLRHLGALSYALPGARHARWDYTVAMLYYAQSLDLPGMNSSFTLGVEFSSALAALQSIALCWNIGHLPGTYAVEKGVYRWLHDIDKKSPTDVLEWPNAQNQTVQHCRKEANRILHEQDYLGISRVLAAIKLLSWLDSGDNELSKFIYGFAIPYLLSYDEGDSKQWYKLRRAFTVVRHLAYLTLDISLTGLEWCPSIPSLLRQEVNREDTDLDRLSDRLAEVLSPIEHLVYASLYHQPEARKEAAVVADWVHVKLKQAKNAPSMISGWMQKGLFSDLRIGRKPSPKSTVIAGSILLRTHFVAPGLSSVDIESLLRLKGFPLPIVLIYKAWNSEVMLEPDEMIIDANVRKAATPNDVGRLLAWMIGQFESLTAKSDDTYALLQKMDFERTYTSLFKRAFELSLPGKTVNIEQWPLSRFGLFPEYPPDETRGCMWVCDAKLENEIARHIIRDRSRHIAPVWRDKYAELLGLRELRNHLQSEWKGRKLRQRCLLVTASVRLRGHGKDLFEFDGGIAVVTSRGGQIIWYGLESKRGDGDPLRSLKDRLERLGLPVDAHRLSARYAFARLKL